MRRKSVIFLCLLLCGCRGVNQARQPSLPAPSSRPSYLHVEINSPFHDSFLVSMQAGELFYRRAGTMFEINEARPRHVRVSEGAWVSFFNDIDNLNIWSWNADYDNKLIADGVAWKVDIVYPHEKKMRSVHSRGSNAFPPEFDKFMKALRKILGNRHEIY